MKFISTRAKAPAVSVSEAIMQGLAPDGGLYIPEELPVLRRSRLSGVSSYPEMAFEVLSPFFEGDPLHEKLAEICMDAFTFPVPLTELGEKHSVLELYHGPTAAFKDFGARFLASAMEKILQMKQRKLTILVATSGDTGGAVAAAFHGRRDIDVKVLFPKGRVSARQKQQLTCWGDNVTAYEVDGTFDDCQKMVKDAFMDEKLREQYGLSSANSINLGRLLPQITYYVWSSFGYELMHGGKRASYIIPSGNVGNSVGAYYAMLMGAPINTITLALNANTTIADYIAEGMYRPRQSVATLANAMDVGAPSNMERLFALFPEHKEFSTQVKAWSVNDDEIRKTIKQVWDEYQYIICPHTATAEKVRFDHAEHEHTIVVATAHPAKFESVVEPILGVPVPIPENLAVLLDKPGSWKDVGTDYREIFTV